MPAKRKPKPKTKPKSKAKSFYPQPREFIFNSIIVREPDGDYIVEMETGDPSTKAQFVAYALMVLDSALQKARET